jgi:hypothetical protein
MVDLSQIEKLINSALGQDASYAINALRVGHYVNAMGCVERYADPEKGLTEEILQAIYDLAVEANVLGQAKFIKNRHAFVQSRST